MLSMRQQPGRRAVNGTATHACRDAGSCSPGASGSPWPSSWRVPNECLGELAQALLVLVFLLFPSGRFVPRWTRFTLVVFLAVQVPLTFLPVAPLLPNTPQSEPGWFVAISELVIVAGVQLYRYRRVSSPRERQQTKWVVFGLTVPITVYVLGTALGLFFPVLA